MPRKNKKNDDKTIIEKKGFTEYYCKRCYFS